MRYPKTNGSAQDTQRICFVTDSLFNELQKTEYKDYEELCTFEWSSYFFYNLYFKLYNASMDDVYKPKKHLSDIIYLLGVAGALYEYRGYNDQSYRLSTIVEQSAFFMTMFPLIKSLQSEDHHSQTQDSILSYAHWFDAHTQPIATKVIENKLSEIKPISDKEYYEFMVEATKRKVCMLKILKQAIESRKKE